MNDILNDCYLHVGLDFLDFSGNRTTSIQLVNKTRGAIAIADYDNEKLTRCQHIQEVDKTKFLHDAGELLNNSIPVSFRREVLV